MPTTQDAILELARHQGVIRPLDLKAGGLPRISLTRLVQQGRLARVGRGLYALPERSFTEHAALAEVACRHPRAVVCLLSALRFHELTTQAPFEVWLAIPSKARPPRRMIRRSGLCASRNQHSSKGSRNTGSMGCLCGSPALPERWPTASNTVTRSVSTSLWRR